MFLRRFAILCGDAGHVPSLGIVTEAIFGLIGVVIGGLLNGGVSWLASRRDAERKARIGSRLVLSELDENQRAVSLALKAGSFGHLKSLETKAWKDWRETLADVLSDNDWGVVDSYFVMATALKEVTERHDYPAFTEDQDRRFCQTTHKGGLRAHAAMRAHALKRSRRRQEAQEGAA